jgi:hypothetical protein
MPHHLGDARRVLRVLTGLDFGLRVRVHTRVAQRTLFSGEDNACAQELTTELARLIGSLRVYRYELRAELEDIISAVQINVQAGEWSFARRAAFDLADVLARAQRRRLIAGTRASRCAELALRLADLCHRGRR